MLVTKDLPKLEQAKIYEEIIRFLERKERKSKNTRNSYETDIRLFFKIVRNKQIEHLLREEMNITLNDFEDFISTLRKAKDKKGVKIYKNNTINRKISAIKELLKYLKVKGIIEDISFISLIESLDSDNESYDAFKPEEVLKMAELASQERDKSEEKRLLILFALYTGLRMSEILSVKWTDFTIIDDQFVRLKGKGKGSKQFQTLLLKDFYNELLSLKGINKKYVFSLPNITLSKMFERLRDKLNINDGRYLVFHSIRKATGTYWYQRTKDIHLVSRILNHSNITTTQIYLGIDDHEEKIKSVLLSEKIDKDLYKKVDMEIVINAINRLDSAQIAVINKNIMEILNKNNDK